MHLSTRSLIVATLVALAGEATAYTIKTSSQGANLHWGEGEVVFAPVAAADVAQTSIAAIETWQAELVASASPVSIRLADAPGQAAPHVTDGINTIRWAEAADDPDLEMGILANTFVAYRTVDG
ncbi:MAG: hypothetical protein NT062_13495, partial [Proteobacteria bacterium]|nr:hypothetical protein [Pseudomonadota bacterium]